ncbi:hypothetical protein IPC1401_17235 [Pseudomonas aeruginosa]|nr:hypothetical protein IPC1401_17235 [Pseudomonas aeruginosa]
MRVCLRLPAYSASAKVICFIIEKLGDWCPGILPNQEVFFRISLYGHCARQPFMRASYVPKVGRGSKRAQGFS